MAYKGIHYESTRKMDVRAALPAKPIGFLDQLRVFIRSKGLAYTTEKTYVLWVRNFISFSKYQSPKDIKLADVEVYLNHLAQQRFCSPNTQATVLNALFFLFREFFEAGTFYLSALPTQHGDNQHHPPLTTTGLTARQW